MQLQQRTSYVWDRLRGRRPSLEDVAKECDVLFPITESSAPPARTLANNLELVTAIQEESSAALERMRLEGGYRLHRATCRYVLHDALIVGGDLYCRGLRMPLRPGTRQRSLVTPVRDELAYGSLVQTYNGARYFAHWLLDDRPTQALASLWGSPVDTGLPLSAQQHEYLALFEQEHPRPVSATLVRELHVFDDIGQNSHRRNRIEGLRSRFQKLGRTRGQVVFMCRGLAGQRRILQNEAALADSFERRGIVVVRHPERMALSELAAALAGAKLIVGLDSSALASGLLAMPAGASLVVVCPADRFTNCLKDWCDALGIHYGCLVAPRRDDGYVVDEGDLLRIMDLMLDVRAAA